MARTREMVILHRVGPYEYAEDKKWGGWDEIMFHGWWPESRRVTLISRNFLGSSKLLRICILNTYINSLTYVHQICINQQIND